MCWDPSFRWVAALSHVCSSGAHVLQCAAGQTGHTEDEQVWCAATLLPLVVAHQPGRGHIRGPGLDHGRLRVDVVARVLTRDASRACPTRWAR